MSNKQNSAEYEKAVKAIEDLKTAEQEYEKLISQFVSSSPVGDFQRLPEPKRMLDLKGMSEIKEAETKKMNAQKALDKALDSYYNRL